MKKINILPNLITAFGLACGLFAIFKVNMTGMGTYELLHATTLILILAGLADFLDGLVARAIHAETEFGVMFDSLSDAICFGVAPSVLLLKSLSLEQGTILSFFAISGAMLYTLCGVLRLVRFNLRAAALRLQEDKTASKYFVGLPIPAAAAAAVTTTLFLNSPTWIKWFGGELHIEIKAIVLSCLMIVIGYLMISKWRFPKFSIIRVHVPSFRLVFCIVLAVIFLFYGIFYYLPLLLVVLTYSYILIGGLLFSLWHRSATKKE